MLLDDALGMDHTSREDPDRIKVVMKPAHSAAVFSTLVAEMGVEHADTASVCGDIQVLAGAEDGENSCRGLVCLRQ